MLLVQEFCNKEINHLRGSSELCWAQKDPLLCINQIINSTINNVYLCYRNKILHVILKAKASHGYP
jgi:hypothetical protein